MRPWARLLGRQPCRPLLLPLLLGRQAGRLLLHQRGRLRGRQAGRRLHHLPRCLPERLVGHLPLPQPRQLLDRQGGRLLLHLPGRHADHRLLHLLRRRAGRLLLRLPRGEAGATHTSLPRRLDPPWVLCRRTPAMKVTRAGPSRGRKEDTTNLSLEGAGQVFPSSQFPLTQEAGATVPGITISWALHRPFRHW